MVQVNTARKKTSASAADTTPAAHGSFCWNELATHDAERAKKFYAETLGWTFDPWPMPQGAYWIAKMGDKRVGGIFPMSGPEFDGMPEQWLSYIAVDDVDARVTKAVVAGAKVHRPAFDVPEVGRIVLLSDPGGAGMAWMTPTMSNAAA